MARQYPDIDLEHIASEVRTLRESAEKELQALSESWGGDWMNFADLADSQTFDREDNTNQFSLAMGGFNFRTALALAYTRPSDTATAYIMETQRRLIVAASRAFCRLNPYWMAAKHARIAYNVGPGHTYSVVSRSPGEAVDKALARRVLKELNDFLKANQYRRRQGEKLTRGDRDGEYFLRLRTDRPDGILRVRFVEPIAFQNPSMNGMELAGFGAGDGVWFGIRFNELDYEEPVGYFIRPLNHDGADLSAEQMEAWQTMIPADQIQHRKFNVDMSSPRGVPTTYALRGPLTQALSTATSMGRLVDIRARVAVIRKQVNATLNQLQPLLNRNRAGQGVGAGNKMLNAFGLPYGSFLDMNDQRSWEFPTQNIETDKIVHSVKTDLQSAAAALGFADFVLSADSGANFAGALVKEGPMDKAVGASQQDLIDDDIEIFERALQLAADRGRLPDDVLEQVTIGVQAPNAIERNRIQDAQADEIYIRNGALSTETMSERGGFDPDVEMPRIKANPPPALAAAQNAATPSGGDGDKRSHQAPKMGKPTARGVPAGREPGPGVNPQRAEEGLEESSHEPQSADRPTQEDLAMATKIITPEWLATTKRELLGLPQTAGAPRESSPGTSYEPGIEGFLLGTVDEQAVWAVDMDALGIKYDAPDLIVGANTFRWGFVPRNMILVDWVLPVKDWLHVALHELIEQRLMGGGFAYARAHRCANRMPGGEIDFLLELRPELKALVPE
jgi:hypothetical protein